MRRPALGCVVGARGFAGRRRRRRPGRSPALSWQLAQTRCVGGVVHVDVAITGAVVGQAYAIYGTSGLRATNEEVVARAASFTASFTPNEAYGSNDAAHFSVTGDVEAPVIGQHSQVRTISAACAATLQAAGDRADDAVDLARL